MNSLGNISAHAAIAGPALSAWVRVCLWGSAAWAVLAAVVMGVTVVAGNRTSGDEWWSAIALAFTGMLALHAGYLLGPWAAGEAWWAWAFWLMAPLAALGVLVALMPVYGAVMWKRPDGGSGLVTLLQMGWLSVTVVVVYLLPPVILWIHRPGAR